MKKGFIWSKINWEAIAALTAIGGLYISIFQTCQNNIDSKTKEKRDSIQDAKLSLEDKRIRKRDSIQISALIRSNEQFAKEFKRLAERDVRQTALLTESNEIVKDQYEVAVKNNMAYFQIGYSIEHSIPTQMNPKYQNFTPSIYLKNVGKGIAQRTNISFFVVSIDHYSTKTYCSALYNTTHLTDIGVNKPYSIENISFTQVPYKEIINRDSVLRVNPKLGKFPSRYSHLFVLRIRSIDESINKIVEQFSVRGYDAYPTSLVSVPSTVYSPHSNREWSHKFDPSYETISFSILEDCAKKYNFDLKELTKQLGGEYSYNKSYNY